MQQTKGSIVAFMQPQVYQGAYFEVNTSAGTEIVPVEVCGIGPSVEAEALNDYIEGKPDDASEMLTAQTGWLARMSAPGYLDCTAWGAYPSEAEALDALHEMFDTGEQGE